MSLILTKLPLELWYQILSIFTASPPWYWEKDAETNLRSLRNLSQTCRDLHSICSPWWYRKALDSATRPWDPFNCLLVNAASHGHVGVVRQAVDAGFAPGHPQVGIFSFRLTSTRKITSYRDGQLGTFHCGNLALVSILGEATPRQKIAFLNWLFNLGVPMEDWTVHQMYSPGLLPGAAEAGELDVLKYLMHILPAPYSSTDRPDSLFDIAFRHSAHNDTLEYLMSFLRLPRYSPTPFTRDGYFAYAIALKDFRGLKFLIAHEHILRARGKKAKKAILKIALDAVMFRSHRQRICSQSIEIFNIVLQWSVEKLPRAKKGHFHYSIRTVTDALRLSLPKERRMLAYIIKRLTQHYRITWTDATEGGDEPWSFAFMEDCACTQARLEQDWLKMFRLLYSRTPQRVCAAPASRYGPRDRAGALRLAVDLAFSDAFRREAGLCGCRRRIVEFLLDRGALADGVNEGRGTGRGTALHTFCENVFRRQSRGWFEGGPHPWVRFRQVLPALAFLADRGCDVAAADADGRTARDWLLRGRRRTDAEGAEAAALHADSRPDLYDLTKQALERWPVNKEAKLSWDRWIGCVGQVGPPA